MKDREDYYVRYGGKNGAVDRTFYDTEGNTLKAYDKIKLDDQITWKQMVYEPLEVEDKQIVIKSDEVKVIHMLGAKFIVPKNF